jgi:hypothetical protein
VQTDLAGVSTPTLLAPGGTNGSAGNILFSGNGVTIVGSSQDVGSNTGVAGFFGSDAGTGQQPQSIASRLCESRPWANGFWSSVLPVSFFDNLCTWQGYQVGTPAATTPVVQLQQTKPQTTHATTTVATTTPVIAPQVQIWAVPASVPLDTRTSIFWNTQGVTQCTETSPDGSFNQNSLAGGAATVPLTGATTFTISCLGPDGKPVTDYVTVNLSI